MLDITSVPFGYSYRTEQTYISWIKRFILFHNKNHPRTMGGKEVQQFLNYLAMERKVSSATQNQALNSCPHGPYFWWFSCIVMY
ncbi:MAG: phage integrase N-terminal SAM-like domain-containing protein [Gammaproteobacteria bacterium]|nr:phage integrase N-terminal SAM-like domain-containing protein [Gammaproteobacteria bacterium]